MSDKPETTNDSLPPAAHRTRQRYVALAVLLVGVAASASLFLTLRSHEWDRVCRDFKRASQERVAVLHRTLDLDILGMRSVQAFYAASNGVDREEFSTFVAPLVEEHPGIQALQWAPRVPDSERSKYEGTAAGDGQPDFEIAEYDRGGSLVRASRREDYFPIHFVEPINDDVAPLGFDLAADPACLEAMRRACDTGQFAATSKIMLPRELGGQIGVRLFLPVYRKNVALNTVADRRENLKGFIVGVLRLKEVVDRSIAALTPMGTDTSLFDVSDPGRKQLLNYHPSRLYARDAAPNRVETAPPQFGLVFAEPLDVGGRRWTVVSTTRPQFIAARMTWYPWGAAAAGLLITGLLAAYLAEMASRNAKTTELAARLSESNRRLEREIADRERTQEALRENEEKLRLLLISTAEAIHGIDLQGRCTFCNPACLRMLGYERPDDLLGKNMHDLIHHHTRPDGTPYPVEECRIFQAFRKGEGTHIDDEALWRADGTSFLAEFWSYPQWKDGKVVGAVVTFIDITERKRMENQIRTASLYARSLVEVSLDPLVTISPEGRIMDVNTATELVTGVARDQLVRSDFSSYFTNPEKANEGYRKVLADGFVKDFPLTIRHTSGHTTDVLYNAVVFHNEAGRVEGVFAAARDITKLKQTQKLLEWAKDAAESATRTKSQFLARMSHEIRTPMTAILGYTDLVMDPATNQSSRNNYLAVIHRNGEHLLELINDILDLSKIEAGKFTLDPRQCNLVSLLADVAGVVRLRAEQHGISLSVEYETELPETIVTDAARLRQALINLAGNAVKFTRRGSVRIVTSLLPNWQGQPAVRVQVIDTGIGIREEVLPKLFEPFSQGDQSVSREFGGTGLGLAISRHIVTMLGGELAATSVWGKGSNFNLTVPTGDLDGVAMLENPAEAEHAYAALPDAQPAKELEGLRLLLAEDGYDNRLLIQTVLHAAGAIVETVENGQEAVAKAEPFDAVLMDMNMPVMDGYEATRLLRERGYERPILALTANAMSSDETQCLAAGCNRHLTKPIDRARLIRTIAACTGRKPTETKGPPAPKQPTIRNEGPLVSLYADDPDVAGILDGFVEGLADRLTEMGHSLSDERYDDLKRYAHRLKGAGGSYGYPTLTDAGKKLEDAAAAHDREAADRAIEEVAGLCRAIKEGYQSTIVLAGRDSR